ncbi:hypothetical protein IWX49DRAFT_554313 [Phyllosticta citricarpa]
MSSGENNNKNKGKGKEIFKGCSGGAETGEVWHHLTCGHIISTRPKLAYCGPNCAGNNGSGQSRFPFRCRACGDTSGRWCEVFDVTEETDIEYWADAETMRDEDLTIDSMEVDESDDDDQAVSTSSSDTMYSFAQSDDTASVSDVDMDDAESNDDDEPPFHLAQVTAGHSNWVPTGRRQAILYAELRRPRSRSRSPGRNAPYRQHSTGADHERNPSPTQDRVTRPRNRVDRPSNAHRERSTSYDRERRSCLATKQFGQPRFPDFHSGKLRGEHSKLFPFCDADREGDKSAFETQNLSRYEGQPEGCEVKDNDGKKVAARRTKILR